MNKKLIVTCLAMASMVLTGCGDHAHTYAEAWSKDATNHWHAATCEHTDEKSDLAAHTFGEWKEKADGLNEEATCSVCGYVATRKIARPRLEVVSHEIFLKINGQKVALADGAVELPKEEGTPMDIALYVVYKEGEDAVLFSEAKFTSPAEDTNAEVTNEGKYVVRTAGAHTVHVESTSTSYAFSKDVSVTYSIPTIRRVSVGLGDTEFPLNYGDEITSSYSLKDSDEYIMLFGSAYGWTIFGPFKRIVKVYMVFSEYRNATSIKAYASKFPTGYVSQTGDVGVQVSLKDEGGDPIVPYGEEVVFDFTDKAEEFDPEFEDNYALKFWSWANANGDDCAARVTSVSVEYEVK